MRAVPIFILFLPFCSFGQLVSSLSNKLILSSGLSLTGLDLSYTAGTTHGATFELESRLIPADEVRFFKNNHGYFANLNFADSPKSGHFAMRIKRGAVDLYERINMEVYGAVEMGISDGPKKATGLATGGHFQYYSVNGFDVSRARYSNLWRDLAACQNSMNHLRNMRRYQWLKRALFVTGASVLVGGFLIQGEVPLFTPGMALGMVLGGSSFLCNRAIDDYLWNAVESYNKAFH